MCCPCVGFSGEREEASTRPGREAETLPEICPGSEAAIWPPDHTATGFYTVYKCPKGNCINNV